MIKRKEVSYRAINEIITQWNYNSGSYKKMQSSKTTFVIDKEEIEEFSKWIQNLETSKFIPGGKVFFDKKVKFPKRKFSSKFTDTKIVTDIDKADTVIVDLGALQSEFRYYYYQQYYSCIEPKDSWTTDLMYEGIAKGVDRKEFSSFSYYHNDIQKLVERINILYGMEGKNIVDVKDLSLPSEEVLDLEAYERLRKMFQSTDFNMVNMAMRLLTAYDYDKEKVKIAVLLSENIYKNRGRKDSIEVKSMLRKLEIDFPSYCHTYNNARMTFLLKLAIKYPEDDVIQAAFNHYIKDHDKDLPNVKLTVVK